MAHSLARVLVHFVWSTTMRAGWIDRDVERVVRDAIAAQLDRLDCPLLAFGAADDHVHVLAELHRNRTMVAVVRAMKGASGHDVSQRWRDIAFHWQKGYGAFSVSEREPGNVVAYVRDQRERHASGDVEPHWEPGGFEMDASD